MKAKNSTHYFEIYDMITQFCSAFDSVIIGRFDNTRTNKQNIRVRFTTMPKQRVLHSLVNKAEHITLPVISVNVKNIERDNDRVQFKNSDHFISQGKLSYGVPTPVPVNVSVKMSIFTRQRADMDQIISNFIPYSDPYIIISWKLPKQFSEIQSELRSEVLWDGSISMDDNVEQGEADKDRYSADTSFIIKGWLFKRHHDNPNKPIHEIDINFIPISKIDDIFIDESELQVETRSISAYPLITATKDDTFINGRSPILKLEGDNFEYTTSVYLSTDSNSMFTDPISSYDEFDAIELSSFSVFSDNVMYIDIPELQDIGNVLIIVENDAGYVLSDIIDVVNLSA